MVPGTDGILNDTGRKIQKLKIITEVGGEGGGGREWEGGGGRIGGGRKSRGRECGGRGREEEGERGRKWKRERGDSWLLQYEYKMKGIK